MATQYTDEQIKEYMDHVKQTSGSKYTPEQLAEYEKHVRDTNGPDAPGFSADNPARGDLYGNDMSRLQGAWGNLGGITPTLKARGMSEVAKNSNGEIVAKGADGKWYADQDQITKNPMNWLESASGKAPAMAGMMLGGAGGFALGGKKGAMAGAGVGATAGEALRQKIAQSLGIWKGDTDPEEMASEGVSAGLGEGAAQVASKVAAPVIAPLKRMGGDALGYIASKMSGVPEEATSRMWARPDAVSNPPAAIDVAKKMAGELSAQDTKQGVKIRAARQAFDAGPGKEMVNTSPLISQSESNLANYQPNSAGYGKMPETDLKDLSSFQKDNFLTPQMGDEPAEGAVSSRPVYSKTPTTLSPGRAPVMASPLEKTPNYPYQGNSPYNTSVAPQVVTPGQDPVVAHLLEGHESMMPEATGTDLRKAADYAGGEVERGFDPENGIPSARSGPYTSHMENMYGATKDALHTLSPDYGAADAQFHQYAKDAKLLRPVLNEGQQENFVKTLGKEMPGKSNAMDAAERQTPMSNEDLLDMRANHAFDNSSKNVMGMPITQRQLFQAGAGLTGAVVSNAAGQDKTDSAVTAALLAGALSPKLWKYGLKLGSKYAAPVANELPAAIAARVGKKYSPFDQTQTNKEGGE